MRTRVDMGILLAHTQASLRKNFKRPDMAIEINIIGNEPVAETVQECLWAGYPVGTPIKAYGQHDVWQYIWMGNTIRLPNELEAYLFRS